ncbi:hypothetical protein PBY51_000631 [Eleginops maclovinus]|uniref:HAT C-terminal dimerisation domain-containing protein n=1 Tax=Eleginops maclovinus TaxID=56733 RepID=A0AAN7XN56_ELEMC|nr:hypothetical protein PBY51_000631 [Eleginops maclovinus]
MRRHLESRHPDDAQKPMTFFLRKEAALHGQKTVVHSQATVPTKALAASYKVAHLVAKAQKPHTIAESLILPAAIAMTTAMHGEKIASVLKQIPLSNDTMSKRINDIANDMKCQLIERVKNSRFSLQLDESTDLTNVAHLMVFIRYSHDGKLHEDMLCCSPMEGRCTGGDIFNCLNGWMEETGLDWDKCISICTDGAGAMMGKHKGLKAKVLSVAPHVKFTHCIIHREALASKTLEPELNNVLQTAIQIVNSIKSRPLNSRLFALLCQEMGSAHESLLFHSEVRWLSRGKVLTRLFELRSEVRTFLSDVHSPLADHLTDSRWLSRLAYLACIFDKLNSLNLSLQGPSTNILTLSDKVNAFTKKLQRWAARAESGDFEMFSELHDFLESDMNANSLKESITCHLRSLLDKFNKYFLTENVEPFDWVRQPFTNCSSNNLPSELEDALIELSSDRTLQASFASKTLDEFWLSVVQEYPGLSKAAMDILTPFGSTYLCEKTFSSLAYIKNKYRCRLNSMEENLRVAVSSIDPRIDLLCSRKQAHPSH